MLTLPENPISLPLGYYWFQLFIIYTLHNVSVLGHCLRINDPGLVWLHCLGLILFICHIGMSLNKNKLHRSSELTNCELSQARLIVHIVHISGIQTSTIVHVLKSMCIDFVWLFVWLFICSHWYIYMYNTMILLITDIIYIYNTMIFQYIMYPCMHVIQVALLTYIYHYLPIFGCI